MTKKGLSIAAPGLAKRAVDESRRFFSRHTVVAIPGYWEGGYMLISLENDQADTLYWALRHRRHDDRNDIIGGGQLRLVNSPEPLLREALAGMFYDYQGKGWYPKILRALRVFYDRPIESDVNLSLHNDRMWKKLGVPRPGGGYRLNPARNPSRRVRYTARELCWLNTELRLPPESRTRR